MFGKNLRYYRLKNGMTRKALAEKCSLTPMAITNYEDGKRMPEMDIIKKLANALDVRVMDFLAVRNENLVFEHGEFRKTSSFTKEKQEFIRESVEEYFSRFFTTIEILGGEVFPDFPVSHFLPMSGDIENDAKAMRIHLGLAEEGPVENLITILENKGILIYSCEIDSDKFSGMNGFVNKRPYIVINSNMSPERCRSTLAHELAHLMFEWPIDMDEKSSEETATAIAGAFLFPKDDVIRELGVHRNFITYDMTMVCREYGISMMMLAKRAKLSGVITASAEKDFYVRAGSLGWRKHEPSRIDKEVPTLFEQLVFRAVSEQEISIQRGAELLKTSYDDVRKHCIFQEAD